METRILVIGGGASGFFSAINLARRKPEYRITILEKSNKVLSKVRISGGGRCNVTNSRSRPSELVNFYPRGGKKLYKLFEQFSSSDMSAWLQERNVPVKTEEDLRVFPVTDNSETIITCFRKEAEKYGVDLITGEGARQIGPSGNGWVVTGSSGKTYSADKVIIAAGASPALWKMLSTMGIKIETPVPSLFTFKIRDPLIAHLQGISFKNTAIKVSGSSLRTEGSLLITHWGLSGPAALKLSAWGAREFHEADYHFNILVNFTGDENQESCRAKINSYKKDHPKRLVIKYPLFDLPKRFWERLCTESGISESTPYNDIGKKQINRISNSITQAEFSVEGKSTFKEEFVTCGGVSLNEINLENFESRRFPGLYFSGEVLDIDALTGGFNFQACWSSAWVISQSL